MNCYFICSSLAKECEILCLANGFAGNPFQILQKNLPVHSKFPTNIAILCERQISPAGFTSCRQKLLFPMVLSAVKQHTIPAAGIVSWQSLPAISADKRQLAQRYTGFTCSFSRQIICSVSLL